MPAPQTQIEIDGKNTTHAQEEALLAQIDAETSATVTIAGHSVGGLPIRCVSIGNPDGPALMVVSGQHGTETRSREGIIQFLRDVAYSEDPAVLAALEEHQVVVIPTVNADGLGTVYDNANGVSTNRDYLNLTQPESQAVFGVLSSIRPLIVYDAHESSSGVSTWQPLPSLRPDTHPALSAASVALLGTINGKVTEAGWTTTPYPLDQYSWSALGNMACSFHGFGILGESSANWAGADRYVRAWLHRNAAHTALRWLHEHTEELEAARAASILEAVTSRAPVVIPDRANVGGTRTTPEPFTTASVSGYVLAEPIPQHLRDAHGIVATDTFVSVQQKARSAVVALCDPASVFRVVSASRVPWPGAGGDEWEGVPLPGGVPVGASVQVGGMRRPVLGIYSRIGGVSLPARIIS